jgi:hypothetical protein
MLSIICRYLLLLLISSILITTLNEFCQQDVAASPFFGLEEIKDGSNDWTYTDTSKREISTKLNNGTKAPGSTDIIAVNYISDGKTLNATLWLSADIEKDLSFNNNSITTISYNVSQLAVASLSKNKSCTSNLNNSLVCRFIRETTISKDDPFGGKFASVIYGMLIDADSNIKTGWNGADYELQYATWNGTWTNVLFELSSTGGSRELKSESNITGFFGGDKTFASTPGYVTLSLDLGSIHYPNSYRVLVYTSIGSHMQSLDDFSSWIDIPPNQFDVSTLPKPVVLKQGDQEDIPFQLKSPGHSVNRIINLTEYHEDNGFSVSQSYKNPLSLRIKVPPDSSIGVHEIPMIATISTESNASHRADSFFRYKTQGNINVPINLAITVLKPLTPAEKFKEFWGIYGQPISIILGGFAGGMTSLIFDRFKKKKT